MPKEASQPLNTSKRLSQRAESMRDQLAGADSLPLLTLLGLLTGLIAGTVIVLFRWMVEIPLAYFLPDNFENFEAVSSLTHLLLPLEGAVLLGLILQCVDKRYHAASCRWALNRPIALRFALAGLFTGICALWIPQIMGVGYDTISSTLAGEIGFALLLVIAVTKLLAASISLGVGMPGGVVGPLLLIGACVGGAVGSAAQMLMPGSARAIGFYVILGMGAMMGATLNAPLAAMMAILELTYNPNIIFPSMLVVIAACLTTRWVFRCDGLFQNVLRIQGKFRNAEAMEQLLSRTGVRVLMDRHLVVSDSLINLNTAQQLLVHHPHWILLREHNQLLQPADLNTYLQQQEIPADSILNLQEIPARRYDLARIAADANVFEALDLMNRQQINALWVESLSDSHQPLGIISRAKIDNYYRI